MKKLILLVVMAVMALAGCQKSEVVVLTESNGAFTASVEEFSAQTKTALTPENYVVWSSGDRLAIFQGSAIADEYQLAEGSAGLSGGSFKWVAKDNVVNDDFSAGTELPCNVAYYPYSQGMILKGDMQDDGKKIFTIDNVVFPEVQNYAYNSFGNGTFPMVAVTANMVDHNLKFKNIGGALKLQLKGTQLVKSIKIEGNNGEKLSGAATVTAYANNLAPVIKMASDASETVTLDCGDGFPLNEIDATNFYISLPPVVFSNGFTVTVTDTEEKEYTLSATDGNTIHRSGILVMPEVILEVSGEGAPEEDEDDVIPVESLTLSSTYLKLYEDDSAQLVAKVRPVDATYKSIIWRSSDPSIASVDQTGLVRAISVGTAEISAQVQEFVVTCTVEVKQTLKAKDYVDEFGVNHGPGVAIGMAVWAPVNCGYEAATADYKGYPYGKLYQWGRKYGQGYDSSDATTPELSEGGVSLQGGQSEKNKNVFYTCPEYPYDWLYSQDGTLWNSGSEESPVKTEYDPCPDGWRVPTYAELSELYGNRSSWTQNDLGQSGYWFSGPSSYSSEATQVFFPAAGYRGYYNGDADSRGYGGYYWSSRPSYDYSAYYLSFSGGYAYMNNDYRANGYSVRCVQD